ncbi:VOC family protein [Shewanella avicenniae]
MLSYSQLMASLANFATEIQALIDELGLQLLTEADHIALRVNSNETAEALSQAFAEQGTVISNNIINGRPILIIALNTPIQLGAFEIACVELPFPSKPYPQEGWEHIELVLPQAAQNCEQLTAQLLQLSPKLHNVFADQTEIKFKASSPSSAAERLANPTIAFKKGDVCIKVHPHRIETIIASEQQG